MTDLERFLSRRARAMHASAIRRAGDIGLADRDLISLAPGFPDPALFAWDALRDIAEALLTGADGSVLQYGATRGFQPLLDVIPDILSQRGIRATHDSVMITTGSQQALDLSARVLADPGDVVFVELPAYAGAMTAFGNAGAQLVGVRQDADGIDLDDLDALLLRKRVEGRRAAFVYVVPNFQNPSGLLMGLERRRALLQWAARRDVLIVEDDPYGALYFEDAACAEETRPLKADDEDDRVLYLSSFSKTVAPGFRVAWATGAEPLIARLEIAKQSADLCTGGLDQRLVCEMWRRGALASGLPALRKAYQTKRRVMEEALHHALGDLVSWPEPKGGFFLWASLSGVDTDTLFARALQHKVVYVPGSAFFVDHGGADRLRLAFSASSPEQIRNGIGRLAAAVREERDAIESGRVAAGPGSGGEPAGKSGAVRPTG
jgi:2-aminoadipate transaminase